MGENLQLLSYGTLLQTSIRALPLDHTGALLIPPFTYSSSRSAALSCNECLWFSLRLWFSNDVYSSPNSWKPRNRVWFLVLQEFGALQVTKVMDSWLHNTDKNFCPDLP